MNLAVSCIAWRKTEHEPIAEALRGLGVAAVEGAPDLFPVPLAEVTEAQAKEVRRFWQERGLRISSMQAIVFGCDAAHLFAAGDAGRAAMAAHLRKVAMVAGWVGAGPLVFGAPRQRARGPLSADAAFDLAQDFFSELAPVFHDHGCVLCLEANAADYGCDFMVRHQEAARLAAAVGHPGVGLQVDLGVMAMNGEGPEALTPFADMVRHVHVSCPLLAPVGAVDGRPGVDEALLAGVWELLAARGYGGLAAIEMKKLVSDDADSQLNVRSVRAAVQRVGRIAAGRAKA